MSKTPEFLANLARPVFKNTLKNGWLEILEHNDPLITLGDDNGPGFTISVDSPFTLWKIYMDPDLGMGEAYVENRWNMVSGDLGSFLTWLCRNQPEKVKKLREPRWHTNDPENSRRHVAVHYDIGNDLYQSFLDEGMNYSCAFFSDHRMSLRDAQCNKIYTTLQRLDVHPGMNVLDIGCGWGEMARTISRSVPDVRVTGITLAENQLAYARQKALRMGEGAPEFHFADYREHARRHAGAYDRIVSIGMFEHVGAPYYREFFDCVRAMLKPGGRALIHSIMRPEPGQGTSRWLDTYIFPGGSIPYLPNALEEADASGLKIAATPYIHESANYAETLRRWRANFNANAHTLDPERYNMRFRRIWNFYLASSEAAFDGMGYFVAQMMFEK